MDELRGRFRPEFLNRLDEIVIFHPLRKRQLLAIAELQLTALRGRLKARDITLRVPPAALAMLVDLGWSPEYGARPLKRTVQKELEAPLARALLSGAVGDGDEVEVLVNREDAKLTVRRVEKAVGEAHGEGAAARGAAGVA
jgi:ATP-dependent Clp protease ATP-binding subunit ClpA